MKKSIGFVSGLLVFVLCGCTGTGSLADLQKRNEMLESKLQMEQKETARLERRVQELETVATTLGREKTLHIKDTANIRSHVRDFVQQQVEFLRDYSQNSELLDFVGGELISRSNTTGEDLLLIDLKNRLKKNMTIIGGKLFVKKNTRVVFCLLRPQAGQETVIWMSKVFSFPNEGLFKVSFDSPVTALKEDVIAIYCPGMVGVPYDIGTGDTRTVRQPVDLGQKFTANSLQSSEKRSYSFGVTGFFE